MDKTQGITVAVAAIEQNYGLASVVALRVTGRTLRAESADTHARSAVEHLAYRAGARRVDVVGNTVIARF